MTYLNHQIEELIKKGGYHTAKEICSQPELWVKTYLKVVEEKVQILDFLKKVWEHEDVNVIFTGAGTSAFIGESLVGKYQKKWKVPSRAISTTDIITHPENYFFKEKPTLLISFARSGDSPESVATIELAKEYCDTLFELNITCNKDGALAKRTGNLNSYVILLPEETNDISLAMTSSYSSMLLTGLLLLKIKEIEQIEPLIMKIHDFGNYILEECLPGLKKIAELNFERMVFLGSGPLLGVAHESHLKVQEMSDGKIIGIFDSFLGFRHGPKVVVNSSTVVVYLFSNKKSSKQYELDLVQSVYETDAGEKSIAVGYVNDLNEFKFDFSIQFPGGTDGIPEDYLSVFYILPAQIIGFYKSLNLGLSPDSPSKSNSISRVVQGVKIYNSLQKEVN